MNTRLNEIDAKRRDARTMFLIKDLLEYTFPGKNEDLLEYKTALGSFIAHSSEWNPGVEEIGTNLLCRHGNQDFSEIPVYNGPLERDNILSIIDTIIGKPVKKQKLGAQARKNIFALSEQILKHDELGSLRIKVSNKLFVLASDIEGAEHQF
jgi:hypothetical protein